MLHTNLLPQEEKKVISLEQWLRIVRFFGIATIAILIIGTILLAPAYLPLYFQNNELKRSLSIQQEATKKINADQLSKDATRIKAIVFSLRQTKNHPSNVLPLFDLFTAPQAGIVVTAFSIDKNGNISLSGTAATRNDLLMLEERLRNSSRFTDITSPIDLLVPPTNIHFDFRATLKSGYAL